MKKYFSLFFGIFKTSLISELEYRFNIAVRVVTDVIWYAAQLSVFEIIFLHTKDLNGWTHEETRVFMGVLFVTDSLYMMFFSENLDRLNAKVRRGELDLLLMKPVDSQWMMSFYKCSVAYLGNFLISISWLAYSLSQVQYDLWRLPLLVLLIPLGLSLVYAIRFSISATALFFTRADAVTYIWYQLYRFGTRPDTIYPSVLRYTLLTILPIGFLASVPTRVILGKGGPILVVGGGLLSLGFLLISRKVWTAGLRRYSSASS